MGIILTVPAHVLAGNIKSLKNNKFIARGRMITEPAAHRQSKRIVECLESQLESAFLDESGKTWTEQSGQSLTASLEAAEELLTRLPSDDNFLVISELRAYGELVEKGQEYVEILVEEI